jgi:hypothetical protein
MPGDKKMPLPEGDLVQPFEEGRGIGDHPGDPAPEGPLPPWTIPAPCRTRDPVQGTGGELQDHEGLVRDGEGGLETMPPRRHEPEPGVEPGLSHDDHDPVAELPRMGEPLPDEE